MSGIVLVLTVGALLLGGGLLVGAVLLARSLAATRAEVARLQARLDGSDSPRRTSARPADDDLARHSPESGGTPGANGGAGVLPVSVHTASPASGVTTRPLPPTTRDVADATLQHPLVRVAVWSAGLRHALRPQSRDQAVALARREFRRRAKLRRRAGRRAARAAVVSSSRWDEAQHGEQLRDERAS